MTVVVEKNNFKWIDTPDPTDAWAVGFANQQLLEEKDNRGELEAQGNTYGPGERMAQLSLKNVIDESSSNCGFCQETGQASCTHMD